MIITQQYNSDAKRILDNYVPQVMNHTSVGASNVSAYTQGWADYQSQL